MCLWCSKESSYSDGSFEYPQRMFWMRNEKKIDFQSALLTGGLIFPVIIQYPSRNQNILRYDTDKGINDVSINNHTNKKIEFDINLVQ